MLKLFQYNWLIREEWFDWCEKIPSDELLKERTGGVNSILKTLFHIIDVEYSWILILQGKPDFQEPFENYQSLSQLRELSALFHTTVAKYLEDWSEEKEKQILNAPWGEQYTHGEIIRHIIAHEIHHIGQLSVWARELDKEPISATLFGKGLF